jgi:cytochrome c biogenesis protein CcmG/thiol:disulfide interchange protein DsbE
MPEIPDNPTPQETGGPHPPQPQEPVPAQSPVSKLLTLGILIAAVALAAVWIRKDATKSALAGEGKGAAPRVTAVKIGDPAPELILKDLEGNTVKLSDLKGKVVLVDFWATWCQPCTIMIPWFVEFQKRYGPQGFAVLGVAMDDEGLSAVKPYVAKSAMNYTVVIGNEEAAEAWGGIFGLPTSFVIDRQGRIQAKHIGLIDRDNFEKDIRSLL